MGKLALFEHITEGLLAAKNFSAELISQLAQIVREIEQGKADKSSAVAVSIPTAGWEQDGTQTYGYYFDLLVQGVTENDRAEITISIPSLETASNCKLCPTNETLEGKIRIRSQNIPASALDVEYWIEKGKE